ncbi:MAG TPA: hypothetical protein VF032_11965 [Thermoleophilaceae bacterium]
MAKLPHVLIALLAAALLAAPAAHAGTSQESIFQDDAVLLNGQPGPSLDMIKGLGANTIHSLVFWNKVAPSPRSKRRPAGDLSNPSTYSDAAWAPYDALVREASARGLQVLLSPTGFAPRWGSGCSGRDCKPNAKLYQQFVTALGRRYSGSFRDSGGNPLPRVTRWSIWNEPDQVGWLNPQSQAAPLYRNLVYAGLAGLKKSGHGHDQVLLGETAPVGRGRSTDPTTFLLNLFCVDSHGHRLKGSAARKQQCTHFKRFSGITGLAHHPYNTAAAPSPTKKPRGKGDITLSTLSRLTKVLKAGAHGHAIRSGLPVYFTEYGIQSNPPDRQFGASPTKQAMYLNQADYIAYKNKSIRSVAQYELFDDGNVALFNTGLLFHSGAPKPSFDAYRLPVWATKKKSKTSLWLWVRPAGGSPQQVQIQHDTGSGFQTVGTKTTNSRGFATVTESGTSGRWRIAWTGPDGVQHFSRAASVKDH